MKCIEITRYGAPQILKLVEKSPLKLEPESVRIQVHACGVNFADVMMRMGLYPEAPPLPFVPGYEVAGVITECGPKVKKLKVGDRVLALTQFGGYTDEAVTPELATAVIPPSMTFTEAASIPVNFLTAWFALHDQARVRLGDHVLIHSAAGGVGLAAVQLAALTGAKVVGLVGNESKREKVLELGAQEVWLNANWLRSGSEESLRKFDVILDSVGASGLKKSFQSLKPLGRVVSFGVSSIAHGKKRSLIQSAAFLLKTPLLTPFQFMMGNRGLFGLNVLKLAEHPNLIAERIAQILTAFEDGKLKTFVGKTFPFEEASKAHEFLQSRKSIGKIVLTIR